MATFTLYFCGTDCWPDEGIENRASSGGSDPAIYGPDAGYIPVKLHHAQTATQDQLKAVIPGPGGPWHAYWSRLWVPSTINTTGGGFRDKLSGESMWDLAGHAAAKVVGIPSMGRGKKRVGDLQLNQLANQVRTALGAEVNPADNDKPPSHDCYQFSADMIELLLAARRSGYGGRGKITAINAIGHSRGGVAAIMVAHELKYLFPGVGVNIFAIDPVPGTGKLSKEMVTLASNVKNYVGVYAVDETSSGFNGVVPRPIHNGKETDPLMRTQSPSQRITIPNYHLIFSPGRHGTVAGNRTSDGNANPSKNDNEIAAVGALVGRLASACLRAWGTDVPLLQFQRNDLAWHKRTMTDAAAKYRAMRKYTYVPRDKLHWYERGITSSDGNSPNDWEYLEDSIGNEPLVTRETWSPLYSRPAPGKVRWQAIQEIDDFVFTIGRWNGDRS